MFANFCFNMIIFGFFILSLFCLNLAKEGPVVPLPTLKNVQKQVTVSGFSSGGAMATQLHVAHSSIISGMGGFSSTFYRCGPGGHLKYGMTCTKNKTLVATSVNNAKSYEKNETIDSLSNLKNSKIFIWSGTQDDVVPTAVSKKVTDFYSNFVPSSANLRFVSQAAVHEFPTDNYGPPCPENTSSFIGNCKFNGAYEVLSTLLGPSIKRPTENIKVEELSYFSQSEFTSPAKPNDIGLDDTGYFYLPKKCQNEKCPLHLFLHGCTLGNQAYQPEFVRRISYLQMAETNSIIMLFPRAARVAGKNPMGCWDVYGGNGDNYATKDAVQIMAIRKMIDRLLGTF